MEIISLNINNFGGLVKKPLINDYKRCGKINWAHWNNAVIQWRSSIQWELHVTVIVAHVQHADIVILHEVDTNSNAFNELIKQMDEHMIIYPNKEQEITFKRGYKSITLMFIKKGIKHFVPNYNFSTKRMKNVEIIIGDKHIIGLHISMGDIDYWNAFITHYKSLAEKKALFIGDLNVYDQGTFQKEKFIELLNCGAIDAWVKRGHSMHRPTANTGKRIDYAIMTSKFYDQFTEISIDDTLRNREITDHSALRVII